MGAYFMITYEQALEIFTAVLQQSWKDLGTRKLRARYWHSCISLYQRIEKTEGLPDGTLINSYIKNGLVKGMKYIGNGEYEEIDSRPAREAVGRVRGKRRQIYN